MSPARRLVDAVIAFYESDGRNGDAGAASVLDRVLPELHAAEAAAPPPRLLPVGTLLDAALAGVAPTLAEPLRAAASLFHWRQNPNYTAANMGAAFMAGYGYVEFAGPKAALFHAPTIRVGLLALGPGVHYPEHVHPAEEVYHPLTEGSWRRGTEDWRNVPHCEAIHHAPMMPHETRASTGILLALYCWTGDTVTEARRLG